MSISIIALLWGAACWNGSVSYLLSFVHSDKVSHFLKENCNFLDLCIFIVLCAVKLEEFFLLIFHFLENVF